MEDALTLIEQLIEEHKTIMERIQSFEQIANDAEALAGFDKAKDTFMPGRLDGKQGLEEFVQLLNTISEGVDAHFIREESNLVYVFQEQGNKEMSEEFHSLILEHEDLRDRLAKTKEEIDKLLNGQLPSQIWQASAQDLRAYVTHMKQLFEIHAGTEQKLFYRLQSELKN